MIEAGSELIVIRGRGSVSASSAVGESPFIARPFGIGALPVAAVPAAVEAELQTLRRQHPAYRQLDRTVLLALVAARAARTEAGWLPEPSQPAGSSTVTASDAALAGAMAVSIGSSRGATASLEEFHARHLTQGAVPAAASPLTTLGNVASWVGFDAGSHGAALSHSSTCSSAFQALANAVAWLRAGMCQRFVAGGTEAPLTDFTLAQMQALGIYSPFEASAWPCRPGAGRPSTFVLGEGAAMFALERVPAMKLRTQSARHPDSPVLLLEGVGLSFEAVPSKTGLSPDGQHFQRAMREALRQAGCTPAAVDAIVLHSPGTPAGDAAERQAVRAVFGDNPPPCTSNKWLVGHTLGASGALSLNFACELLLGHSVAHPLPFDSWLNEQPLTEPVRRVLINAAGFGGNAASVLVSLLN